MTVKIIYTPAGTLLPKSKAPRCATCGAHLWRPIYPGDWPMVDAQGKRLGFIPSHRMMGGKPVCWNSKACEKRAASSAN